MRIKLLLGAVAALGLLVSPASASPPAASRDQPVGDCRFEAVNTNPTNSFSVHYEGEADCEVVYHAKNFGLPTTTHATVTVWLQTEPNHDGGGGLATCVFTSFPVGWVVQGACQISVTVAPSQPLYMCVKYTWNEAISGHFVYTADFDPVTPGRQCKLAAVRTDVLISA